MTKGIMKQIVYWMDDHWRTPVAEQYVFLAEAEEQAFCTTAEAMTGCDVFLKPIEDGGAFEPTSKTWVDELDRYVVIYERVPDES